MKSLSVRIGVILAIGLSISPYAEVRGADCAWILWKNSTLTYETATHDFKSLGDPDEWHIVAAFPRYEHCMERQKQEFLKVRESYKKSEAKFSLETKFESFIASWVEGGKMFNLSFDLKCLPDTVSPMGSKRK